MEEDTFYDKVWYWWHKNVVLKIPRWIRQPISAYKNKKFVKSYPPGTIIENCRYMPAIIIENNNGDIKSWDMCEQHWSSCSLFHCGIKKLNPEYAYEVVDKWKSGKLNKKNFYPDYLEKHPDRYMED